MMRRRSLSPALLAPLLLLAVPVLAQEAAAPTSDGALSVTTKT